MSSDQCWARHVQLELSLHRDAPSIITSISLHSHLDILLPMIAPDLHQARDLGCAARALFSGFQPDIVCEEGMAFYVVCDTSLVGLALMMVVWADSCMWVGRATQLTTALLPRGLGGLYCRAIWANPRSRRRRRRCSLATSVAQPFFSSQIVPPPLSTPVAASGSHPTLPDDCSDTAPETNLIRSVWR
jgi:hypothetical protein